MAIALRQSEQRNPNIPLSGVSKTFIHKQLPMVSWAAVSSIISLMDCIESQVLQVSVTSF